MYLETTITLAAMVATFALSSWLLKSAEISMVITAIVGALVGGMGFPVRVLVEGMFNYLDLAFIFLTATIFINVYSETGAMNAIVRMLVDKFHGKKWVLFFFLAILMLIPGALTGAGSVSILVVGGLVAAVLSFMGLSKRRTAAFIFMMAILSAAAPPINLWAMLMAAQANMPYVGFNVVLLVPVLVIMTFSVFFLCRGGEPRPKEEILASLPETSPKLSWWRIILPPATMIALFLLSQYAAFAIPVLGLPLIFVICTVVSILVNPNKTALKRWGELLTTTIEQVFPLVATMVSVGILTNVMAGNGVRGLIAITFVTLPVIFIYITALFFAPMTQGSLSYGSAVILGTPLIFLFNSVGANVTVVTAALSLMFPLGDCLPPSRIVGRLSIEAVGYEGSYMSFLRELVVPWLFMGAVALIMLIFQKFFSFLVI